MGSWLTYLAALLMAVATAFTYPYSTAFASKLSAITNVLTNIGIFVYFPIFFITFLSGIASLGKDRIGRKVFKSTILWSIISTFVLSFLALLFVSIFNSNLPVTSTTGLDSLTQLEEYSSSLDIFGILSFTSYAFIPSIFLALIFGLSIIPSSDVIRPSYTVLNSLSEAMYRIERTVSYFSAFFVYIAATSLFLNLWHEKTIIATPAFFINLIVSMLALLFIVIPLLYSIFTHFRKNPYKLISSSFSTLLISLTSGNIYLTSLSSQAVCRCNLGVQKRIASTVTPLGILITRGGTSFVTIFTLISLLSTINAKVSTAALILIIIVVALLSFTSFISSGYETVFIAFLLLKVLNINIYGSEAALIALIPFLNGIGTLLDNILINLSCDIASTKTKTDIMIPFKDNI